MTKSLIALFVVLAACGSAGTVSGGPLPQDPSPTDPDGVVSAPARTDDGRAHAQTVEPRSGLVHVTARPFDRTKAHGRNLDIFFWSGVEECYGLDRVKVDESSTTVEVTLFEGRDPGAETCIELAVLKKTSVKLNEPLGGRRVVDGAR